ncbi:hypothetical protein L2E82_09185 [Cichorium intybus]|uniref:Uncharacterized protein n=1 Tax=Cichorium intybus TaxID=13427 RepID=A0ACB9G8T1_CICIN|nr:hypothetical protein L2E82_09185 [Cichorium intybus]
MRVKDSVAPGMNHSHFKYQFPKLYCHFSSVSIEPTSPLVCDLDKRTPHRKKVLGLDVVVWWDKNDNAWKVFDDTCPHRLAPLSEGRIDQKGRLQFVYHGWCLDVFGDCKLIPQAPPDGPPVNLILLPFYSNNFIHESDTFRYEILIEYLIDLCLCSIRTLWNNEDATAHICNYNLFRS